MLKDNWKESLPVQTTCSKGIQGTHVGNMIHKPLQGFSDNDHRAGSSTRRDVAMTSSGSTSEYSIPPGFNNQSQLNHSSETQPTVFGNSYGTGTEKLGSVSHNIISQLQPNLIFRNTLVEEACNPLDNVRSQMVNHNSFHPPKSCSTDPEISSLGSNLQELVRFLSANYGPMKMPQEAGTPEYLRLVEILQQNSVQHNGFYDQLNGINGGNQEVTIKEEMRVPTSTHQSNVTLTEDESSRGNQKIVLGHALQNDLIIGVQKTDEKKLPTEKASRIAAEKLWEGSLQLSSSVTLSAVAYFKSGEKLLGSNWPESVEVKGKVRLDAFEKYVQDLPRSRNRGLMVISVCWNEGSSDVGLTGMKEVAKGYKKSSRVGFAQLLSGTDLYICPRSDPIITILAKYGFFKGMSVLDDKPDSMIGCVVWRKNRPLNPVGNSSDNSIQPQNFPSDLSIKPIAEKQTPESSQHDNPITLSSTINESCKNLVASEVDLNGDNSTSNSGTVQNSVGFDNLVQKRAFEDDDLPEFDFGNSNGKSTLVSQSQSFGISSNIGLASGNCQKLDDSRLTQLPPEVKIIKRNNSNSYLDQSSKKTKLFDDDDDDDMPEWCPPELPKKMPPQSTTTNFQALLPWPPLPPTPPPPRADTRPLFSYQPFRPAVSSPPPAFMGGPPPLPPLPPLPPPPPSSNQALWHQPGMSIVHPSFPPSIRGRPRP